MLVKDGRYREVYIPEYVHQELREVVSERVRLVQSMSAISNQVTRWLDLYSVATVVRIIWYSWPERL